MMGGRNHGRRSRALGPWRGVGDRVVQTLPLLLLLVTGRARALTLAMRMTATVRESETRLRALMTNLPVILFALDADGVFTLSDGAGLAPLGVAPGQVVGHSYRDVHAEHPEIMEGLGRALAGEAVAFLHQMDGHTLDARATPVRDARGRVTGVIGVSVDVTDRARAEEALRAEEARYRAVADAASDAIIAADGAGRIVSWNRGAEAMFGYSFDEALGHSLTMLMPAPYRAAHQAALERLTVTGEARLLGHTLEMEALHKDGRTFPIELSLSSWTTAAGICYSGIIRDITERSQAAQALRVSEARFRALTEHANDLVCILAHDGTVRYESPSYERLLGARLADLQRELNAPMRVIHPDDRALIAAVFDRVTRREIARETVEFRHRCADGSWRTLEAICTNHLDDPAVDGIVVTSRDITERMAAQEALRADAERLSGVIATQQEVALADLDTRVVLPLIAARAQELTGADGAVVELAEGEEMVYHAVTGTLEGYEGTRLPLTGTLTGLCVRTGDTLYCADAAIDPRTDPAVCRRLSIGSMVVVPLRHGGAVVGALKVSATAAHAFDARAVQTLQLMAGVLGAALGQVKVFAALRASEECLRTVVANAPLILFTLDPDGIYTMSDGAGLAALGREPDAVVGCSVFDVYRDQPDLLDYTRQALAGTPVTFPSRVHGAIFDTHLAPLHDAQGRLISVIGVSTNITERARAEAALAESRRELERSNAELAQFAYVASHDLQEPLRTVTSYLKLLQRRYQGKLGEDADEFIGFATEGAQRMSALIKAVLEYSRVGTRANSFAPTDCQAIVAAAVANLEARIAETGARVTYAGLPTVLGDDVQLGQLFQNLIGNALKFCRDTPEVTISAERQGDAWLVRVRDNGIGIAPEYAERIFQMFQRLHTRTEYEGTGIGLPVCKRIVERHGGQIWAESELGQGATFLFTLPACDVAERCAA